MNHLPRGTVTLLFTDMEVSTRLLQQLGERYTDLLEEYRQLLRAAFQRWNGNVVDTQGDAFFVAFARATDAVSGAVAAQRDLVEHDLPTGVSLRDLGVHRLKDLQQKSHLYLFVIADIPTNFTPLKTLDTHPNNLPAQPTPLI